VSAKTFLAMTGTLGTMGTIGCILRKGDWFMNNGGMINVVNDLPRKLRDLATSANALASSLGAQHARTIAQWSVAAKCAKDVSEATAIVEHFRRVLHGGRRKRGTGQTNTAGSKRKKSGRTERSQGRNVKARVIRLADGPRKKEAVLKPGSATRPRHV
jgi:hypothetical protein